MNKKDIMLVVGLFLIAGLSYFFFEGNKKESGNKVVITVDGVCYGIYGLNQNREIEVKSDNGYNVVVIRDGKVSMKDADCPDHYCVKQGEISDKTETIICLPHKLIVEVDIVEEDLKEEKIDIISK